MEGQNSLKENLIHPDEKSHHHHFKVKANELA